MAKEQSSQSKGSFSVPAPILQANSHKTSVRDLNAEFQKEGGKVAFKTTKKGTFVQLSHKNEEYLEDFKGRLYKELGLNAEDSLGGTGPKAPTKPGGHSKAKFDEGGSRDRPTNGAPPVRDRRDDREPRGPRPDDRPPRAPRHDDEPPRPRGRPRREDGERKRPVRPKRPIPDDIDEFAVDFIFETVKEGKVIDDGQIIKEAYDRNFSQKKIKAVRKALWNNRCRSKEDCPYKRKKLRFEEMMRVCGGARDECEFIESPLIELYQDWRENLDEMFAEFLNHKVIVKGKISEYNHITREGEPAHYKILVYDTLVLNKEDEEDRLKKPKETRKLWMRIMEDQFLKFNEKTPFKVEDIVEVRGVMKWSDYFHDYWIVNIEDFKVILSKGENLIRI